MKSVHSLYIREKKKKKKKKKGKRLLRCTGFTHIPPCIYEYN